MSVCDKGNSRVFSHADEEGPYKPVPPPKPVPNNQKNQDGQQEHEQREQTVAERSSRTTSGPERSIVVENGQVRGAGQPFAPEYRMPPLYGEEQSSSQAQQAASLQTHSSKFPVSATIMCTDREITALLLYFLSLRRSVSRTIRHEALGGFLVLALPPFSVWR